MAQARRAACNGPLAGRKTDVGEGTTSHQHEFATSINFGAVWYHIYELGLFAVGQKHALWRGMYGRDRESGLAAFVEYLPTLAPALVDFVRLMRFHLAPLTCHMRLRRRIEAALARHLSSQPGLVGAFQDMGIRYLPRRAGEEPIQVRCQSSVMLLGLPSHLEA
jgi:hypothetical protein